MPRILLVEPKVHASNTLARVLLALGYDVDCAYSAGSAIDYLRRSGAELVILSVRELPGMHGWQLLNWLGQRRIRVIVHDRFSAAEWQLAKRAGATEHWVRGTLTVDSIGESLERYLDAPALMAA
jgi:DNA-binding response OmpR family regulator